MDRTQIDHEVRECIRRYGPIPQPEIADKTGHSADDVRISVGRLVDNGLVNPPRLELREYPG